MTTVSVFSFEELKEKIEDDTTTDIIVENDIIFSGGIKVNLIKSELVIDFNNHSVLDSSNLSITNTIYIPSTTNKISVTIKNATWNGKNYYGVIGVNDGNTNTIITLDNINYIGPQFVYNKNGTTNINNCYVTIDKNDSLTTAQEFCEGNRINILGNVTVISNSSSDAVIWFTGANASLTVYENAKLNVNCLSTYFLYTDSSPSLLFEKDSSTLINTNSGLFYASGSSSHIASSFTLEENASFIAYKQHSNSIPMFKCQSNFTLKENSTFRLFSEIINSTPLIYFGQKANINIISPKNVVLYNRGGNIFSFGAGSSSTPNEINISAEMLRLWNIAKYPLSSAGDFNDKPTTEYYKKDYTENINLSIKATTSQLTSVENNLTTIDIGYPITTTSLKLLTSNVISIGKVILNVDNINDNTTNINGFTNSNANLIINYDTKKITTTANSTGNFNVELENKLSVNSIVEISSNYQFLTKTISYLVSGTISITNLQALNFYAFTTNSNKSIILRQLPNFTIEVTDSRISGDNWYLYAHIENPLSFNNEKLENTLIFKNNNTEHILNEIPLLIFTGKWNSNNKVTTINWGKNEGFLLKLDKDKTYVKGDYKTNLIWQITTTPLN